MSFNKQTFEVYIHRVFVAYSDVYIESAVGLEKPTIIQPYERERTFPSTKKAVNLYKVITRDNSIPILFTSQDRYREQFFEYRARLLYIFDTTRGDDRVEVNTAIEKGHWILPQGEEELYARNVLVVTPIKPVEKIPVNVATNFLPRSFGKRVGAVSIPAPKLIDQDFVNILIF